MFPGLRAPVALLAAGLACVITAGVLGVHQAGAEPQATVTALGASPTLAPADHALDPDVVHPTARGDSPSSTAPPLARVGTTPVQLLLPTDREGAAVVPVGTLPSGDLQIPDNPAEVGWWAGGAAPGDAAGTVVIAGHLDSRQYGLGFFAQLGRLEIGQTVTVTDSSGQRVRYAVSARAEVAKAALPRDLFSGSSPGRLVLITCGGSFSRADHYSDNVIVTAMPLDNPS